MLKTSLSKRFQGIIPVFLLLTFSILITSCNVQDKKSPPDNSTASPNDTPVKAEKPYTDVLFFIEGQLCQHLRKMHQDKRGNLWFGTNVYGLMRYDGDSLVYFSEKDGLGGGRITGIVEDKEGNVWFGTYRGLTKYDGKSFTNFSDKEGLVSNDIWSVAIDSKGILWIGTMEGVSRFDGKVFTAFPIPPANVKNPAPILSQKRITAFAEDKNGNIWIGTDGCGIYKYDGENFTQITKEEGLCDNNIYDLMVDTKGNIWVGTMFGGVCRFDGKSFTNFTLNGIIDGVEVGGIYEDKTGNLWFAAENYGVYCYNGKSFTNYNTKDGLNTNGILCILQDREERFWFGGWGGLFRFDGKSFVSVTKDGPWAK